AFVNAVPFDAIRFILDAARLNGALSQEGLRGSWGLHIGSTLAHVIPKAEDLPPQVEYQLTEHGGHVGFIGGTPLRPEMWLERRI
ncbi:hypothetical protein MJL48_31175, partial [Salmonella enterica subsp. enterica serovar Kentucky]|nr:hypothetical protein [Salmonella enterica subsp. enterica serovar Kentucky]